MKSRPLQTFARKHGIILLLMTTSFAASGCHEPEADIPDAQTTAVDEQFTYTRIPESLCGNLDYEGFASIGDQTIIWDTNEDQTSKPDYTPASEICSSEFHLNDTYSHFNAEFTVGGQYATIADQMAEIRLEPWDIYPYNDPTHIDRHLPEEELPQADIRDLEFEGWDAVTLINIVELSDDLNTWDPDGRGIHCFMLFQHDNLVIQLELQKKALEEEHRPDIEPYVETLADLADQMRDQIAEASA